MSKDFSSDQPAPAGGIDGLFGPDDQGGAPKTGFADAPQVAQDRGGPGPGVPPNTKTIR